MSVQKPPQSTLPAQPSTKIVQLGPIDRFKGLLDKETVKGQFDKVLGKKAPGFVSSLISAFSQNKALQQCDPMSVISAAMIAASLDLPITPGLGFAHIVPYKGVAQFQLGWKGYVQLGMRSAQYRTMHAAPVHEGQLVDENEFTGEMMFRKERASDKITGYVFYFKLLNGFEKYVYMSRENCELHAKRYSQSYKKNYGTWVDDFDAMALKTVVKQGLSKWGVLSVEMQKAIEVDQGVIEGEVVSYPDNPEQTPPAEPAETKTTSSRLEKLIAGDARTTIEAQSSIPEEEKLPFEKQPVAQTAEKKGEQGGS